jgi:hypothetical protein
LQACSRAWNFNWTNQMCRPNLCQKLNHEKEHHQCAC